LTTTASDTEQETVTKRLPDDSCDSAHVVTSVQEHDKMHLNLDRAVVLLKELFNFLNEDFEIVNLSVDSRICINTFHVVSIDEPLSIVNAIFLKVESLHGFLQAVVSKPVAINVVDQTVTEDTKVFVKPQPDNVNYFLSTAAISQAKTLRDS